MGLGSSAYAEVAMARKREKITLRIEESVYDRKTKEW
jgi:hypothetical protein